MKIVGLLFLIVFSARPYDYIKDYFSYTSIAKYKLNENEIDSSILLFEKAFEDAPYIYAYDEVLYAKALYEKGELDKSYEFLLNGIERGFRIFFIDSISFSIFFQDSIKVNRLKQSDNLFKQKLHNEYKYFYD